MSEDALRQDEDMTIDDIARDECTPITRIEVLIVMVLTALFLFAPFPYYDQLGARKKLDNPNEVMRAYSVRAMGEFGHLYLNDVVKQWPTRRTDMSGRARRDDEPRTHPTQLLYPSKSPGMAPIAAPAWWVYHKVSTWTGHEVTRRDLVNVCRLSMQMLLWLGSLVFYLFLRHVIRGRFIAQGTYWVMTLGTMGYAYSMIFASHQLATMSLLMLFVVLSWRPEKGWGRWPRATKHALYFAAGLLGGLAVSAEYSAVLPACVLGLYGVLRGTEAPTEDAKDTPLTWRTRITTLMWSRRHLFSVILGVAPIASYTMWYHKLTFGGVLETPYKHMLNPVFRSRMEQSAGGFQSPSWETMLEIYFGTTHGLFTLSPFLVLALGGIVACIAQRRHLLEMATGVMIMLIMTLYLSSVAFDWVGGWSVGPRYLSNVLPAMGLLAAYGLDVLDRRRPLLARALLGGLGAASIMLAAPVSMVFPHLPGWLAHPAVDGSLALITHAIVPLNRLGLSNSMFAVCIYSALAGICVWLISGARKHSSHPTQIFVGVCVCVVALLMIIKSADPNPKHDVFVNYVRQFEAVDKK